MNRNVVWEMLPVMALGDNPEQSLQVQGCVHMNQDLRTFIEPKALARFLKNTFEIVKTDAMAVTPHKLNEMMGSLRDDHDPTRHEYPKSFTSYGRICTPVTGEPTVEIMLLAFYSILSPAVKYYPPEIDIMISDFIQRDYDASSARENGRRVLASSFSGKYGFAFVDTQWKVMEYILGKQFTASSMSNHTSRLQLVNLGTILEGDEAEDVGQEEDLGVKLKGLGNEEVVGVEDDDEAPEEDVDVEEEDEGLERDVDAEEEDGGLEETVEVDACCQLFRFRLSQFFNFN